MSLLFSETSPQPSLRAVPALEVRGLQHSYGGTPSLRGVDLNIEAGEISALLGPNGAGKSTLVSAIVGLRTPSAGTVRVCGYDVRTDPARVRSCIGLVPQELGVYPTLTVVENLTLFGELAGVTGKVLRVRIDEVLETLRLSSLADRRTGALSGGERRRVHTAAAMVHRPALLLLDEPTAGVDVETRHAMLELIKRLSDDGVAVLYATHYLQEVENLDASVTILDQGRVLASSTVNELVECHGAATVELTFDGPVTGQNGRTAPEVPSTVRLQGPNPAVLAANAIAELGDDARRLRSVEIVPASLDAVFLSMTGRRFRDDDVAPDVRAGAPERGAVARAEWRGFSWRRAAAVTRHGLRLYRRDLAWVMLVLTMPIGVAAFLSPALGKVLYVAGVRGASGAAQVFPGMAVLFGLFLCSAVPIALFNEHAWKTWDRLRASPATSGELVVGKLVPPLILLLAQFVVLFSVGVAAFDFRLMGGTPAFLAVAVAFACAVITLGLSLAVLCRTILQANAIGNMIGIAGAGVGGAFVPISFLPDWAATLGPATPSYWAMRGWKSVTMSSGGLGDVALPVAMLVGFSIVFALVGLVFLRVDVAKESGQ